MTRPIRPTPNYSDWTKSRLIERLRKLERRLDESDPTGRSPSTGIDALEQGDGLLGHLTDALPVLISYVDSEQRYRLCNKAYEVWFGCRRESLHGRHVRDFHGAAAYATFEGYIERALAGEKVDYEDTVAFRSGGTRHVQAAYIPDIGDDGDIKGVFVTVTDVTELKNTQSALQELRRDLEIRVRERTSELVAANEALRRSEEQHRVLVDASPEMIYLQRDGRLVHANRSALALLQVESLDQLLGRETVDLIHPDDHDIVHARRRATQTGQTPDIGALRYLLPDGGVVVVEITSTRIVWEGQPTHVIIGRDITARKQAEDALLESEARYRLLVETSPEAAIIDQDGEIVFANRSAVEVFGAENEARLIGRNVLDFIHPEEHADVEIRQERLSRGEMVNPTVERRFRRLDGSPFDGETRATAITLNGRTVWLVIFRDITERKQTEHQLRQAQKMEAVGQLTGGVAHDFNNLLAVILGNAELLGEQIADEDGLVDRIVRAATRGADLTHRLLAFSRRQPLRTKVTDVDALITGMLELLRRTLGETIRIDMETGTEPGPESGTESGPESGPEPGTEPGSDRWNIVVDPAQLESAILNIAINARDAMPNGGTLEIGTANFALDRADVAGHDGCLPGDYVRLAMVDSGVGMSADVLEHALEPFFTTKDVGEGSGLGLSMIYGFVKQSGGFVEIGSEPGLGCAVRLYLPRAVERAGTVAANDTAAASPRPLGGTVLVVEDDPDVRELVVRLLTDLGCATVEAQDGESALARLRENADIAFLFIDVVLPHGMSGPDIAREAVRHRPDLKVVFTSGYPDKEIQGLAWDGERPRIVAKPYTRAELAEALSEAEKPRSRLANPIGR